MRSKFKLLSLFLLSIYFISCKTSPEIVESKPDYIELEQKKFYAFNEKLSQPLIQKIRKIQTTSTSFKGNFVMKIRSGKNLSESNVLKGSIDFQKATGRVKIQRMEPFFGMIVSTIEADKNSIFIKSAGQAPHKQTMGDIQMIDPASGKTITIPFPVIYYSISLNFLDEFKQGTSFFSPTENRVLVKTPEEDIYQYVFSDTGLEALEYKANKKNVKAISRVTQKDKDNLHPPKEIGTRVTELDKGVDIGIIDIKYTKIIRE